MKIEKILQSEKNKYLLNQPSENFLEKGWIELEKKLPEHKKETYMFDRGLVRILTIVILLAAPLVGLMQVAQGALPGEPLYSVKRFSENMFSVISKPEIKIENRAKEIVDLAKKRKDSKELNNTVEEYKKNVKLEKEKTKSESERKDLKERLEKQEEEFKKAIERNSASREEISKAIEASREGRGEGGTEKKTEENKEVKVDKDTQHGK